MYKVFSINQKRLEINIWDASQAIRSNNPDLLGAQEINDHAFEVIGHLGPDYKVIMSKAFVKLVTVLVTKTNMQVAGSSSAGHAIIYRESALTFEEWNLEELNEQV